MHIEKYQSNGKDCLCLVKTWLCLHIWEEYRFTAERAFLEAHYDAMREAARFCMDFLVDDGEYLVTIPTLSPENSYLLPSGEKAVLCKGAAMDCEIIRELLNACLEAQEILNLRDAFADEIKQVLSRLRPIQIGKYGQIMEWEKDYEEAEPGHRHISQLFALYPGTQITQNTPEWMEAARKTIERRLSFGGGYSGWSRAWIICMYARLGNGNKALENIEKLIHCQTLPNLFDNHPPFQIDGNFG